jgi:hypothetical protein
MAAVAHGNRIASHVSGEPTATPLRDNSKKPKAQRATTTNLRPLLEVRDTPRFERVFLAVICGRE